MTPAGDDSEPAVLDVVHRMRAELVAVRGTAELLRRRAGTLDGRQQAEMAATIESSAAEIDLLCSRLTAVLREG